MIDTYVSISNQYVGRQVDHHEYESTTMKETEHIITVTVTLSTNTHHKPKKSAYLLLSQKPTDMWKLVNGHDGVWIDVWDTYHSISEM